MVNKTKKIIDHYLACGWLASFSGMGRAVVFLQTVFKSHATDLIAAGLLLILFFAVNVNTVLNNQYYFGGTLFDSTIPMDWESAFRLTILFRTNSICRQMPTLIIMMQSTA